MTGVREEGGGKGTKVREEGEVKEKEGWEVREV